MAVCGECARLAADVGEAVAPPRDEVVLTGVGVLVTNDPRRGEPLGVLKEAAVAVRRGRVTWVGPERDLPARYRELPELACRGRAVIPGLVDPSNRLLITPDLDEAETLADLVSDLLERGLEKGVTAVDLRSGGVEDPTRAATLLAVAEWVGERLPMRVSVTWSMGPMEPRHIPEPVLEVVRRVCSAVELPLDGWPSPVGLPLRLRGRWPTPPREAEVVTVETWEVPVPPWGLPLYETTWLVDGSLRLGSTERCALGSGSGGVFTLTGPMMAAGMAILRGLRPEWALWAITRGGALALNEPRRGRLRPGDHADLVVLDTSDPLEVCFRPDDGLAWRVVVDGSVLSV